jgi:hypothetical protein
MKQDVKSVFLTKNGELDSEMKCKRVEIQRYPISRYIKVYNCNEEILGHGWVQNIRVVGKNEIKAQIEPGYSFCLYRGVKIGNKCL